MPSECIKCKKGFKNCGGEDDPEECEGLNRFGVERGCQCKEGYVEDTLSSSNDCISEYLATKIEKLEERESGIL